MPKAAIYARYSTDEQRGTSLEDQVRRCREEAARLGFEVPDQLVFSDAAISGTSAALGKRAGYHALVAAWEARAFDAIIVDEVSRLARDQMELARLQERVESTGVRLVSSDGLDSSTPNWQLPFGIAGVIGSHFIRETRHRVKRGMKGQLERGYQIADTPIGYQAVREIGGAGKPAGTRWVIDEEQAVVVRQMFQMRLEGSSFAEIARHLNGSGIKPPRRARDGGTGFFRAASVLRYIQNSIYKGLFVWNGSASLRCKARKAGQTLTPVMYPRPELRLVSDETWERCNARSTGTSFRGGRKHLLAGLAVCGDCGNKLVS